MAVNSEETGGDTCQDQHLYHNSHKHQNKINTQAAEIATVRLELDKVLQENQKLEILFNPDQLVEAMTRVVSTMTMKECPMTSQDTQYKGASSYVGMQQQPQLAHGANGMLQPNITCHYFKDTRHMTDNWVQLNNKITHKM